jgi:hypothetical protein
MTENFSTKSAFLDYNLHNRAFGCFCGLHGVFWAKNPVFDHPCVNPGLLTWGRDFCIAEHSARIWRITHPA